ncbi:MAG: SCP2 sterol-binding domain-containing protein [Pseudomonadota bacterium]
MSKAADNLLDPAKSAFLAPFAGVLRVECTDDGSSLWIDGRGDSIVVSDKAPPEVEGRFCLWRSDRSTLSLILSGQRHLETAYTSGRVKISGDMAVMARLELKGAE